MSNEQFELICTTILGISFLATMIILVYIGCKTDQKIQIPKHKSKNIPIWNYEKYVTKKKKSK